MAKLGQHAIVLGASMGGMLAARVLADFYQAVTVVERDVLSDDPTNRRGVPQGRHTHGLLASGRDILERLFPGFSESLIAHGAVAGDIVRDADILHLYKQAGFERFLLDAGIAAKRSKRLTLPF